MFVRFIYNELALSDVKLLFLGMCLAGEGGAGADNVVNALYGKGAQCVLGFKVIVYTAALIPWQAAFIESLASGSTVADAMLAGDDAIKDLTDVTQMAKTSVSVNNRYLVGLDSTRPCS